jgi:hypothetical protein
MKEARRVRCMTRADSCAELPDNRCSETLYPVSSAALSAKGAIEAERGLWGIENRLN